MKRSFLSFLILLCIVQIQVNTLTSCANIIPPTGGARDSLPPVLIYATPKDSTLNFNTKKIVLSFDEYVQLDNQAMQTSLIVSPTPEQAPYISSHLRDVTIRLKDSLKPNTTYSINFGKALKDVNEGNPYKNFTYVFSTGSTIANGSLTGSVQLAQTGKADSTLIVLLHSNLNDSAIKKLRPDYYASLDSGGHFSFKYLANGTYNVFVLPNDYSKRYDDSTKIFAFLNAPVTISDQPAEPVSLLAYNEYEPGEEQAPARSANEGRRPPADTAKFIKAFVGVERGQQDLLSDLSISFQKPLKQFDSSKISLTDTNYKAIPGYHITADTSFKNFDLRYAWKESQHFKLFIHPGAFTDSLDRTTEKIDTVNFQTKPESEYGSVRLRFFNIDMNNHPVLQLIQSNKVVDSVALTNNEFYRKLYKPGEYEMRILYDDDRNLSWTPGSYALKKQPEIVVNIPRKLTIKPNWDNEINVNL